MRRDDWITATTDKAHAENWAGIHTSGFCKACANVYTALKQPNGAIEALAELVRLKDGPRDDAYRAVKDAAWDAAREILRHHPGGQAEDR